MLDFLRRLLFEDLSLLLPAAAIAMAVVIGLYRHWRTPESRNAIWIALLACMALFALQQLVVTDREAIRETIEQMAAAVQEGDVAALGEHFASDSVFESDHGKDAVARHAKAVLTEYAIRNARVSGFQIEVNGDNATARFQAMADVRGGSNEPSYNAPTTWDLKLRRDPAGWLVYLAKWSYGLGGLRF